MPDFLAKLFTSASDSLPAACKRVTPANEPTAAACPMARDVIQFSNRDQAELSAWSVSRDRLNALGHPLPPEALQALDLAASEGQGALFGVNPKIVAQDAQGNKFLLKPKLKADPEGEGSGGRGRLTPVRSEVETMTANLRQAAGEPNVMVGDMTLRQNGKVGQFYGKPMLKNEGKLPDNTASWTASQRNTVMADDVWSRFLGNYDTKVDQYIRVSDPSLPEANAINVDWDLSLSDYMKNKPVDRFKCIHRQVPTAPNRLYQDYVHGKVELNFAIMLDTARRVQALPDAVVAREVLPAARKLMADGRPVGPYATPEALVAAVQANKATSVEATQAFIADLQRERAFHAAGPLVKARMLRESPDDVGRYLGYAPGDAMMLAARKFSDTELAAKLNLRKQAKRTQAASA